MRKPVHLKLNSHEVNKHEYAFDANISKEHATTSQEACPLAHISIGIRRTDVLKSPVNLNFTWIETFRCARQCPIYCYAQERRNLQLEICKVYITQRYAQVVSHHCCFRVREESIWIARMRKVEFPSAQRTYMRDRQDAIQGITSSAHSIIVQS